MILILQAVQRAAHDPSVTTAPSRMRGALQVRPTKTGRCLGTVQCDKEEAFPFTLGAGKLNLGARGKGEGREQE